MSAGYFDEEAGRLRSEVFASASIYRDEIARLFSRSWLLVAPVAWLGEPGDFVTSFMGSKPVVAWRGPDGALGVFLNRCLATQEPIAGAARGRAEVLPCPCHGWPYSPAGGTGRQTPEAVGRVEAFGGFLFANLDPDAPPLREWIGDFAWCWDLIAAQYPGGIEVIGATPLQSQMRCNWKLASEAYAGDVYSDLTLTKGTRELLKMGAPLTDREGFQISTPAGAMAVLTDASGGQDQAFGESMTPILATLFPNISYDGRAGALHVWHPLAVNETAAFSYGLAGRAEPSEIRDGRRRRFQRLFGPTGLLSQDHNQAWSEVTRATAEAGSHVLNLEMGLGRERSSNLPGKVGDLGSEMNQRTFYGWWQRRLASEPPRRTDKVRMSGFLRR